MEYEGIPYLVKNPSKNQPDNLYNPDEIYTPIGTATIEKGEITSVEFSATPAGQAAKDLHANREEEKETDEVEEADAEPEDEQDAEEETNGLPEVEIETSGGNVIKFGPLTKTKGNA